MPVKLVIRLKSQSDTFLTERSAMAPISPSPRDRWSLDIFHMTSCTRQQRALKAFARVGMPGVQALGVVRPDGWFVIVDSITLVDEIRARRILRAVDPAAVASHRAGPRRRAERASPLPMQPQGHYDLDGAAQVELEDYRSLHLLSGHDAQD